MFAAGLEYVFFSVTKEWVAFIYLFFFFFKTMTFENFLDPSATAYKITKM